MRDIKLKQDLYSVLTIVAHCFMGTRPRVGWAVWLIGDANPLEDSWVCLFDARSFRKTGVLQPLKTSGDSLRKRHI